MTAAPPSPPTPDRVAEIRERMAASAWERGNDALTQLVLEDVPYLLTALAAKDAEVDRLTAEAAAVRAAALEEAAQVAEADAAEAALDKTGSKLSHEVWLTAVRLANAIRALGAGGQP